MNETRSTLYFKSRYFLFPRFGKREEIVSALRSGKIVRTSIGMGSCQCGDFNVALYMEGGELLAVISGAASWAGKAKDAQGPWYGAEDICQAAARLL